ncbi:MAG: SUMF1/EgtB/PvdO family nonheme iron enzyme [Chloroflexota bacterium]
MPLTPGQTLKDRYRIDALLGRGGFGAVYRAWDENLETPRAIKENLDTSLQAQRQFKREAQILDRLSHPNLPKVIDHFVIPEQGQYLVMEFVEGQDLQERLAQAGGRLPEAQVLEWTAQVCAALEYLHAQNPPVIHRDIKPANIKITPEGRVMLVDFGIAKLYDPGLATTAGARAVTPGYSPQEQYGSGATDARTDVYALGATLYHLLTGEQPPESIQRNLGAFMERPRRLNPGLSVETEKAVLKALEMLPEARFQRVADLRRALASNSAPGEGQTPAPRRMAREAAADGDGLPPVARTVRVGARPGWQRWAGAVSGLALVALLALWLYSGGWSAALPAPTSTPGSTPTPTNNTALSITSGPLPALPLPTSPRPSDTPTPQATVAPSATPAPNSTLPGPSPTLPPPTALPTQIVDVDGAPMALAPAGAFQMGSQGGDKDEQPRHEVYLLAFYIDLYEVTNARYAVCVKAGVCEAPAIPAFYSLYPYFGDSAYDNHPVVYVSWNMAQAYCQWRGARLPTEAEWEKAGRGGLDGNLYPWGDEAPACQPGAPNGAAFEDCGAGYPQAVGAYTPNGYGLFDMAGNVWEWASSLSMPYPYQVDDGRESLSTSGPRLLRGGSWASPVGSLRVALRFFKNPEYVSGEAGFRCAR